MCRTHKVNSLSNIRMIIALLNVRILKSSQSVVPLSTYLRALIRYPCFGWFIQSFWLSLSVCASRLIRSSLFLFSFSRHSFSLCSLCSAHVKSLRMLEDMQRKRLKKRRKEQTTENDHLNNDNRGMNWSRELRLLLQIPLVS